MPIIQNGTELKRMYLPGTSGNPEIGQAYMWNGSGWDLVFEAFEPYEFFSDFNNIGTGRLTVIDPNNWLDVPSGSVYPVVSTAVAGAIRAANVTADGIYTTTGAHKTPCRSDNFEVTVTLAEAWTAYTSAIVVGSNAAMTDMTFLQMTTDTNAKGLFTMKAGTVATSVAHSGSGASGDQFTLRKTVVGNSAVYAGFKNGVQFVEHVDPAGNLPVTSEAHRYAGFVFTFRRAFFTNYYSVAFTDFRVRDLP